MSLRLGLLVVLCALSLPAQQLMAHPFTPANHPGPAQPAPAAAPAAPNDGDVAGTVFRDLNFNGQRDANEPGLGGLQLSAYTDAGLVATTTSNADGTYAFQPAVLPAPVRIELTTAPAGFYPSPFNAASAQPAGLVRFVQQTPARVDFALSNPADFCAANPSVATSCFVFGNPITGIYALSPTLYSFPYASGTTAIDSNAGVRNPTTHALAVPANQLGSTWALAYQRESGTLLAAAFTKRHAGYGPAGTGGIYAINPANSTASVLLNLNVLLPGSTGPDLHEQANFFLDGPIWDAVGKTAFGGMDLSIDGETLWVMNLHDRRLYRLPVGVPAVAPTAAQIVSYPLPTPPAGATGCVAHPATAPGELNRNLRPFAVKATATSAAGAVYIGMVCTAESSQLASDLRALIYQLDVATGAFTPVANFPLNYARGCVLQNTAGPCATAEWMPWAVVETAKHFAPADEYVYPQPMLSDIEFDDAGNMLISLADRFGHETSEQRASLGGPKSLTGAPAGDLLKLGRNADGTWTVEQNGQAGGVATPGQGSNQGPGGGEFYWQDNFPVGNANTGQHQETTLGGLAVLPGRGEVLASAYNPTPLSQDVDGRPVVRTTGPIGFNTTTGARARSYLLTEYALEGYFTQAAGMGDLELMCEAAPVEIGNRVWRDTNANGVQDPSEPSLPGITVRLYTAANTLIATTTTDADGRYAFNTAGPDRTPSTADDLSLLGFRASTSSQSNTYTLRLDHPNDYAPGAALAGLIPTVPNASAGPNSAAHNSKATLLNGYPSITFSTGKSGQNTDTYDFGMTAPGQVSGRIWLDTDHDGLRSPSDAVVPGSLVTLVGAGSLVLTTTTDATGAYTFAQVPPGNVVLQFTTARGYSFTTPLAGDPQRDSDVTDVAVGRTGTVGVPPGIAQTYVDAGVWQPGALIRIRAFINGEVASALPGPTIAFNTPVNWSYVVTNTGDIALTDISVINDQQGLISCPATVLAPGQTMSCAQAGLALGGQYTSVTTVYALDGTTAGQITSTDTSHYFGSVSAVLQVKLLTNGEDADVAPGPQLPNNAPVRWTYVITNAGAVTLTQVTLIDNRLGNIDCPEDTLLAGQAMTCQRTGKVFSGVYENRALASAAYSVPNLSGSVSAIDFSHYEGVPGATLRGSVWFDVNANGRYNDGEPPMAGVRVSLFRADSSSVVAAVTTSDYNGAYIFNQLLPGSYIVGVTSPAGYGFTPPLIGEPGADSDIDPATGLTRILDLGVGQTLNTVSAGLLARSAGLSVRVLTNQQPSSARPGPTLAANRPVTWTYRIYNTGSFTLTNLQVVDRLQGLINCSPSPLPPGAPLVCEKYGVAVPGAYASLVSATGTYLSSQPGITTTITATDAVHYFGGLPALAIHTSANPDPAGGVAVELNQPSSVVTYTLSVSNLGTYTATQVVITDALPAGMAYQASLSDTAVPARTQGQALRELLTWTIGTLAPGTSAEVIFTSKALSTPPNGETTYVNAAYVSSLQTPSTRSNLVSHVFKPTVVSLARFTANSQANGVLLEWRTSLELNTFGFVLHRSGSTQFEQAAHLGRLIPATHTAGGDYAFFDSSPDALVSYYWIEEVTGNGEAGSVFGPVSARLESSAPGVLVPGAVVIANAAAGIGGGVILQPIPSGPLVQPSVAAEVAPGSAIGPLPDPAPQPAQSAAEVGTGAVDTASVATAPVGTAAVEAGQTGVSEVPTAPAAKPIPLAPATSAVTDAGAEAASEAASEAQPLPSQTAAESRAPMPAGASTALADPRPDQAGPTSVAQPQANARPPQPSDLDGLNQTEVSSAPAVAPTPLSSLLLRMGLALFGVLVLVSAVVITLIARSTWR